MNKEKQKIVPALRFPEFIGNDDWKEYQLKEFLELLTDFEANGSFADVKKNVTILNEPDYAWYVRATDLEKQSDLNDVKYVNKHSYDFLKKTKLFGGELLITKRGEIGKVYLYESVNGVKATVAPNMYLLKMLNNALPKFFYYYFINHKGNESLKKLNASSTIGALYKNDVKNLSVYIPLLKEQQKIANCLSSLDNVIAAETEKLDHLKDHKKGLLQQLFPANGETKPQYRFPEFENDGNWEEKMISELANRFDNLRKPVTASNRIKGTTPYYGANGIQSYIEGYTHNGEFILVAEDGANDLKNYPVQYATGKIWVNNHAHVLQGKIDICNNLFLMYAIQNANIEPYLVGGGRAKLNANIMMKINLLAPQLLEQQKIANCLSSADDLIEEQTKKIAALKNHKKGLMQRLFPNVKDI